MASDTPADAIPGSAVGMYVDGKPAIAHSWTPETRSARAPRTSTTHPPMSDTPAVEAARKAFWLVTVDQTSDQMLDRALAVFEPLIRAEENEACARLMEQHRVTYARHEGLVTINGLPAAGLIRARNMPGGQ